MLADREKRTCIARVIRSVNNHYHNKDVFASVTLKRHSSWRSDRQSRWKCKGNRDALTLTAEASHTIEAQRHVTSFIGSRVARSPR